MTVYRSLYKAVWYWDEDQLLYHSINNGKEKLAKTSLKQLHAGSTVRNTIIFQENVDQIQKRLYRQKYQRTLRPSVPNVVTIQDIKDLVTYLAVDPIPECVINLFHSCDMNNLLRALIVYIQLYLQVWEDLRYRRRSYSLHRLKHPTSTVRESRCKSKLSQLRCRIGQQYALLIAGEGNYKMYHHMNNTINRSYTANDIKIYDYLFKMSARVVWIALYRRNYREIESEICRLFNFRNTCVAKSLSTGIEFDQVDGSDRDVLHGDQSPFTSHRHNKLSPVISDIFINDKSTKLLLPYNVYSLSFDGTTISGLEAALTLPEELLQRFGITMGILGQNRESFEVMLHVKQVQPKSVEEEELENVKARLYNEIEKPTYEMYKLLEQLETTVDLTMRTSDENIGDINEEIRFYLSNQIEDSKRGCQFWRSLKAF